MTPLDNRNSSNIDTCCFCQEISSDLMPEQYSKISGIRCRRLYEDTQFVLFPSVSPLATGHVLLVPKQHVTSSVQLSPPTFSRLDALGRELASVAEHNLGPTLFWEHGIGLGASGGCGVSHAHIHLLPMARRSLMDLALKLNQRLPLARTTTFALLPQLVDVTGSYLYWSTGEDTGRVELSTLVPSQFMRNLVAEYFGDAQWNWRELYNWDLFGSTLNEWGHLTPIATLTRHE